MNFLLPQARLAAKKQIFRIDQPFKAVHAAFRDMADETAAEISRGDGDFGQIVLGAAILIRAIDRLQSNGRYCLFRRPTRIELYECEINGAIDDYDGRGRYYYHFYEVPGFRFIVLLSPERLDGFLIHVARVSGPASISAVEQLKLASTL